MAKESAKFEQLDSQAAQAQRGPASGADGVTLESAPSSLPLPGVGATAIATVYLEILVPISSVEDALTALRLLQERWLVAFSGVSARVDEDSLNAVLQVSLGSFAELAERGDNGLAALGLLTEIHRHLASFSPALTGQPKGRGTATRHVDPHQLMRKAVDRHRRKISA